MVAKFKLEFHYGEMSKSMQPNFLGKGEAQWGSLYSTSHTLLIHTFEKSLASIKLSFASDWPSLPCIYIRCWRCPAELDTAPTRSKRERAAKTYLPIAQTKSTAGAVLTPEECEGK